MYFTLYEIHVSQLSHWTFTRKTIKYSHFSIYMISISEHNKKVAVNRWRKVLLESYEKFNITSSKYPELKARIIGYLVGDGSVSMHREINGVLHHSVDFYPDDEHMLKSFTEAFVKIYGVLPKVKNLGKYYSVRISSKPVALDLLSVTTFSSLDWVIPSFKSEGEKKEFLRAIYDCEGYVGKRIIAIQSVNENGLKNVQLLLKEFNIESKLYHYVRKNANWNTNHLLYITAMNSRRNFLKHIGFYHSRKQVKLLASVA